MNCRLKVLKVKTCGPVAGRGGFSLIEVMMAIGILAVGMAMVASLFPAGIIESAKSINNFTGSMAGETGIAIARIPTEYGQGSGSGTTFTDSSTTRTWDNGKWVSYTNSVGDIISFQIKILSGSNTSESPQAIGNNTGNQLTSLSPGFGSSVGQETGPPIIPCRYKIYPDLPNELTILADGANTELISPADQIYGDPAAGEDYNGFVVLGRKIDPSNNQIVVISYHKFVPGLSHTVVALKVRGTVDADGTQFTLNTSASGFHHAMYTDTYLVVIASVAHGNDDAGLFAKATPGTTTNVWDLDRDIGVASDTIDAYIIAEYDGSSYLSKSPAIALKISQLSN